MRKRTDLNSFALWANTSFLHFYLLLITSQTQSALPGHQRYTYPQLRQFAAKRTKKARRYGELVSGNIRLLHSAGDLTAAQAASACINMLRTSVHDRLDALHIGLPSTVGTPVGMRHLNAKGNALVAKLTFCHKLKHLLACV